MDKETYFNSMKNISSVDGRWSHLTSPLRIIFSESALHKYRTFVEIKHLIFFCGKIGIKLNSQDNEELNSIHIHFSDADAKAIIEYDLFGRNNLPATNHDVKAVEYYLKERLTNTRHDHLIPYIHFGLTSDDVNNIAFTLMLKDSIEQVWLPELRKLCSILSSLAKEHRSTALLSRTHGQPASPTTFGKEMAFFLNRLAEELKTLRNIKLNAKLNGATGNFNAFKVSFPDIDWLQYSTDFITQLGLEPELISSQRGPTNRISTLFQTMVRVNSILKDLDLDLWLYTSRNLILQRYEKGDVGSSTMPHKINPWWIECSESNIELSNALLEMFVRELEVSRLQRDLSDHDHLRNFGTAVSYSFIAIKLTYSFLERISINRDLMLAELSQNPQILSEAFQTILRSKGRIDAYESMKSVFREYHQWDTAKIKLVIDSLDIDAHTKQLLMSLRPESYIGEAEKLVDIALANYDHAVD